MLRAPASRKGYEEVQQRKAALNEAYLKEVESQEQRDDKVVDVGRALEKFFAAQTAGQQQQTEMLAKESEDRCKSVSADQTVHVGAGLSPGLV